MNATLRPLSSPFTRQSLPHAMKRIHASAAPLRAALSALLLGACVLQVSPAFGQATARPPEQMTYQGFLVGSDGVALGDTAPKNYDVIFKIYNHETASAGANLLWAEQQTVTVDKGYFSVLLGEGANTGDPRPALSTLFKGTTASDRFVGITVKGIGAGGANVDILPRLRLMTAPYAHLATYATKLVRDDNSSDLITSSGNVVSFAGHLDVLGANSLEFGAGLTKQNDAGRMGYQLFSDGLDIVGAGTAANNRKITMFAEGGLTINGPVTATSFTGSGAGLTGVAKPTAEGHLRLGDTGLGGTAGWGSAAILSGAPGGDNSDPLWLARYNTAGNSSELRMVIGDDPGSTGDKLVVGTMQGDGNFNQGAAWAPQVTIDARGFMGLNGRSADYPLTFPNTLGDKISLWGNAGADHYGFGIQNSTLQIYGDGSGSRVAFGYGSSGSFNYYGLINYDAMYIYHPYTPQLNLQRTSSGTYANMYNEGTRIVIGMTGSYWGGSGSYRYATFDGDGNWDFNSDRKLKKDIADAPPVLERALQVQVRNFRWKDGPTEGPKMIGVIAQELQPLFPDMVSETENPETKEKSLSVGYGDFAVIAIKAIQELKVQHDAEVKDLKAQVAELKAQMKEVLSAAAELRGQADKSKATAAVAK